MNDNEKYLEKLKTHRRHLHQSPEIDRDLPETKEYLLSVLEQLDCELTFLCGSGICAWFDRGAADTFAFRSDMDGLPVTCPPIPARCTPAATTDTWPCCSASANTSTR